MQLSKFRGLRTCPTWNFGGNVNAAHAALSSDAILRKVCVSKNVCHDVVYDAEWHQVLAAAVQAHSAADPRCRRASALGMIHDRMGEYLRNKPGGKKLHDPLALAVALDESVCQLAEVSLFSEKGHWGSVLCCDSGTWISVAYDAAKFQRALLR
jgi:pyrimidine-specific ribonucleoside hydrolase